MALSSEQKSLFRRKSLQFGIFTAALVTSFLFQNCSVVSTSTGGSGRDDLGSLSQSSVLTSKAMSILTNKCSFCHNESVPQGGIASVTDVNYLLFNRIVIPGQPDISDLIRVIREGSMPPTGTQVTTSELDTLTQWVQSGLNDVGVPQGQVPAPTPVPTPTPGTQLTATYSSLASKIFTPKCVGCHNATNADAGVNLSTYNSVRTIALGGKLYSSVSTTGSGYMPKGGARLTSAELTAMNQWITAGAPNN